MISIFIHMEMLKESKMEPVGVSHVNMESENVKEMLSRHVLLKNMTFTLKPFHSLFVLKAILAIGSQVEKDVLKHIT